MEKRGIEVKGALQEQTKYQQSKHSCSSSPALVVRSAREKTPKWAKSLLFAQKSSDVRLEKLEKVIKYHCQNPSNESGHEFEKISVKNSTNST